MMLEGRSILVTGAAGGLGAEIARGLARAGARPILADIDEARGRATADALGAPFLAVDLGEPASIEALAVGVAELTGGRLHGLVNNGAIATGRSTKKPVQSHSGCWRSLFRNRAQAPLPERAGSSASTSATSARSIHGATSSTKRPSAKTPMIVAGPLRRQSRPQPLMRIDRSSVTTGSRWPMSGLAVAATSGTAAPPTVRTTVVPIGPGARSIRPAS